MKKDRKAVVQGNLTTIDAEPTKHTESLTRQMKNGADAFLRVPQPELSTLKTKDGEFCVADEPVMLVGVSAWMWDAFQYRDVFAPLGYNAMRMNVEPVACFDAKGEIPEDFAWWAVVEPLKTWRAACE